ncbi:Mov34/MPN/PAD-1 family protein [Wohlfahrtiimonas chitiniclastica]|uniref:CBASS system CD-NTase/cGAS isopeptidase Cap3 n=1 Tax=Wohlfahrtiimonas chitiniclastica TaxID=400946 RepID=UPI001BCD29BE|nr:Mov34/MPN/PAD-1 family protein [Wohlfahrtiimonas chitiniclastica]MBS7815104.1 Mov34/MPN/PAD-1 family protein [Wohlfahrtiimonas chitiniclastica]
MMRKELVFQALDNSIVVISAEVVDILISYRQLSNTALESAGVLIGERRGEHLVIKTLSEPSQLDIRSRFMVDRVSGHHQKIVDDAFKQSGSLWHYLGEWHTHPEDVPTPSSVDYSSWYKNLNSSEPLILIIVGRTDFWAGKKTHDSIEVLKQL